MQIGEFTMHVDEDDDTDIDATTSDDSSDDEL